MIWIVIQLYADRTRILNRFPRDDAPAIEISLRMDRIYGAYYESEAIASPYNA